MKKILLILALIILLAGVAFVWYLYLPKETQSPADNQPQQEETEPLLLTVINNNVQIKAALEAEFKELLAQTASVMPGDKVKTSATGRAVIESANVATVAVDKNSEFTIAASTKTKQGIALGIGNLWARVQKVFGQGEYYQVETANAVATVRGTSFGISYLNAITIVMVTEGKVSLQSIDPVTKQPIGTEVVISAGEKGTVASGYPPILQELSATDKRSEWYLKNNPSASVQPAAPVPKTSTPAPQPIACTQEAKLCPDGSYVSRTGPNCEFAVCPQPSGQSPQRY